MQPFTVLCAKFHTILCKKISTVNTSPRVFSTNLHAHEMHGAREFRTIV